MHVVLMCSCFQSEEQVRPEPHVCECLQNTDDDGDAMSISVEHSPGSFKISNELTTIFNHKDRVVLL